MRMLCYKCDHSWNYKGNSEGKVYVTCPNCIRKVRIDKVLIEEPFQQKLLNELPVSKVKIPTTTSFSKGKLLLPVHKPKLIEIKKTIIEDVEEEEIHEDIIILENPLHANPVNIEYLKKKMLENKVEIPQEEGFKFMPVKVSDPLAINGERIVMKKYKDYTKNLGQIIRVNHFQLPKKIQESLNEKEISRPRQKPDFEIKVIPRDPLRALKNQMNF